MGITAAIAFFVALGTIGALDCNAITLMQGSVRLAVSIAIFAGSAITALKWK